MITKRILIVNLSKKLFFLNVFCVLLLGSCSSAPDKKPHLKTYVIQAENLQKNLFFTGAIQPLDEKTLTNSMDAVIEKMHFRYGQSVKKGEVVFTLNSSDLQKQYNETLTDYLKAKDNYTTAKAKFLGTVELWHAGLIAKNNYVSEKSSLISARVSLMQATHKLSEMLEKMGDSTDQNLSTLSFEAFDKVRLALTSKHNLIYLKASCNGVLLYPPKASEDKANRITVGSEVKAGQVLALIGDLSGIRVEIDIPEVDIAKIKLGMPATIHSIAFPKDVLQGKLTSINAQASSSSGGTLPSFTAMIEVQQLSKQQRNWVKVGMSAAIELVIESSNKLLVPIAAVSQQGGRTVVQVRRLDGTVITQPIATGAAQEDKVVVDSGLKSGDVVLYSN